MLYEVQVQGSNLQPIFLGEDCRINVHQGTAVYLNHLTVCKKDAHFLYKHHCEDCASIQDIIEWAWDHFDAYEPTPYVLIGPIEHFYFYEENEKYYSTHSRMLVAFVKNNGIVNLFTNARLIIDGTAGVINKLDLSHNRHYNQGVYFGIFDPQYPPDDDTVIAYIPPELHGFDD